MIANSVLTSVEDMQVIQELCDNYAELTLSINLIWCRGLKGSLLQADQTARTFPSMLSEELS